MKIETKFKPGDEVYFVWKGKVCHEYIKRCKTSSRTKMDGYVETNIYYEMETNHKYYEEFIEEELATSKEELLEKLSK